MKIRSMWVWTKHLFMVLIFLAVSFTMGTEDTRNEVIFVDEDVGITADDSRELTLTTVDFILINEAEVEISPGDVYVYVSSTSNDYDRNETLLGSLLGYNEITSTYNESDNRYLNRSYTNSYKIQNKGHGYELFRCDRARCLIYTENIA